jgi:hypothetical protein
VGVAVHSDSGYAVIREIHRLILILRHNAGEANFTNQFQEEKNIAQAAYTGQQLTKGYPCAKADTQHIPVADLTPV